MKRVPVFRERRSMTAWPSIHDGYTARLAPFSGLRPFHEILMNAPAEQAGPNAVDGKGTIFRTYHQRGIILSIPSCRHAGTQRWRLRHGTHVRRNPVTSSICITKKGKVIDRPYLDHD